MIFPLSENAKGENNQSNLLSETRGTGRPRRTWDDNIKCKRKKEKNFVSGIGLNSGTGEEKLEKYLHE